MTMNIQQHRERRPLMASQSSTGDYAAAGRGDLPHCYVCGTNGHCPVSFRCAHVLCDACADALSASSSHSFPCPLCIANARIVGHVNVDDTEETLDLLLAAGDADDLAKPPKAVDPEDELKGKAAGGADPALSGDDEPKKDKQRYIEHRLTQHDSFAGLCLRYGTTVDAIRMHNHIITPCLDLLPPNTILRIPLDAGAEPLALNRPDSKPDETTVRNRKIKYMMSLCKIAEEQEATYYLEIANWDLVNAVREWKSDTAWEKANPMGPARVFRCGCTFDFLAKRRNCRQCGEQFCAKCAGPSRCLPSFREPATRCDKCVA